MNYNILKVKEWLKFKNPDFDGFIDHLKVWDKEGIPYGFIDLVKLAKNYGTPIPKQVNGEMVIDIVLKEDSNGNFALAYSV